MGAGKRPLPSNEQGYVLLITLFMLTMLTVIGIAALQTSTLEVQISSNNRRMVEDFYATEGGLVTALENSHWWLAADFFKAGEAAYWTRQLDIDGDGVNDALIEIRCVEPGGLYIEALSQAANDIPRDRHIGPPPINSGYSLRHFKIRKYAVTATDTSSGIHLQAGVWKVFGKNQENYTRR